MTRFAMRPSQCLPSAAALQLSRGFQTAPSAAPEMPQERRTAAAGRGVGGAAGIAPGGAGVALCPLGLGGEHDF